MLDMPFNIFGKIKNWDGAVANRQAPNPPGTKAKRQKARYINKMARIQRRKNRKKNYRWSRYLCN